jgi:hypothetical protein
LRSCNAVEICNGRCVAHRQNHRDFPREFDAPALARALEYVPVSRLDIREGSMNRKQIALSIALIALLALDAYAVYLYGYLGFFRMMFANFATATAFIDLTIALVLILLWMGDDAEHRNVSALPFLVLTLALGSVGPLLYLIRRFADRTDHSPALSHPALHN